MHRELERKISQSGFIPRPQSASGHYEGAHRVPEDVQDIPSQDQTCSETPALRASDPVDSSDTGLSTALTHDSAVGKPPQADFNKQTYLTRRSLLKSGVAEFQPTPGSRLHPNNIDDSPPIHLDPSQHLSMQRGRSNSTLDVEDQRTPGLEPILSASPSSSRSGGNSAVQNDHWHRVAASQPLPATHGYSHTQPDDMYRPRPDPTGRTPLSTPKGAGQRSTWISPSQDQEKRDAVHYQLERSRSPTRSVADPQLQPTSSSQSNWNDHSLTRNDLPEPMTVSTEPKELGSDSSYDSFPAQRLDKAYMSAAKMAAARGRVRQGHRDVGPDRQGTQSDSDLASDSEETQTRRIDSSPEPAQMTPLRHRANEERLPPVTTGSSTAVLGEQPQLASEAHSPNEPRASQDQACIVVPESARAQPHWQGGDVGDDAPLLASSPSPVPAPVGGGERSDGTISDVGLVETGPQAVSSASLTEPSSTTGAGRPQPASQEHSPNQPRTAQEQEALDTVVSEPAACTQPQGGDVDDDAPLPTRTRRPASAEGGRRAHVQSASSTELSSTTGADRPQPASPEHSSNQPRTSQEQETPPRTVVSPEPVARTQPQDGSINNHVPSSISSPSPSPALSGGGERANGTTSGIGPAATVPPTSSTEPSSTTGFNVPLSASQKHSPSQPRAPQPKPAARPPRIVVPIPKPTARTQPQGGDVDDGVLPSIPEPGGGESGNGAMSDVRAVQTAQDRPASPTKPIGPDRRRSNGAHAPPRPVTPPSPQVSQGCSRCSRFFCGIFGKR